MIWKIILFCSFPCLLNAFLTSVSKKINLLAPFGSGNPEPKFVIENVFYLPGLGKLIFQSISNRDLPTVQALVMLFAAIVIIANFIVDITYSVIDTRLKDRA